MTLPPHPIDRFDLALKLRDRLNAGELPSDVLVSLGIDPDDEDEAVYGEDIGDECLEIDDTDNDVVDLGWVTDEANPETPETHYQVRRTSSRSRWAVEVMQRYEQEDNDG